jgi:hypothetical protein
VCMCVCVRERQRVCVCIEEKISENRKGGGGVIEKEQFFSDRAPFSRTKYFRIVIQFFSEMSVARKYLMK